MHFRNPNPFSILRGKGVERFLLVEVVEGESRIDPMRPDDQLHLHRFFDIADVRDPQDKDGRGDG